MLDGAELERLILEAIVDAEDETTRLRGTRSRGLRPGSQRATLVSGMANRTIGLYVALDIVRRLRRRRKKPPGRLAPVSATPLSEPASNHRSISGV